MTRFDPVGRRVRVCLMPPGGGVIEGVCCYTPAGEGDCWRIQHDDGRVFYIQHFEMIYEIEPREKAPDEH